MMPCWHHVAKVWHSFLPGKRVAFCGLMADYKTEHEWLTSTCLPSVDPKTMHVCDKCFREYCVEVISY